mgnify:CR=1 FL=1
MSLGVLCDWEFRVSLFLHLLVVLLGLTECCLNTHKGLLRDCDCKFWKTSAVLEWEPSLPTVLRCLGEADNHVHLCWAVHKLRHVHDTRWGQRSWDTEFRFLVVRFGCSGNASGQLRQLIVDKETLITDINFLSLHHLTHDIVGTTSFTSCLVRALGSC